MTDVSKSPEKIAGMFDAIAGRYDFLNHLLSAGIDRRWRSRAIASLALTGRERVLDLCTGTADLAIAAVRASPGAARVVGVDFSDGMLQVGAGKLRNEGLANRVALVRGDATRIPIANASVDAVTVAFGIRNVDGIAVRVRGDPSRVEAGRAPRDSRVRGADGAGNQHALPVVPAAGAAVIGRAVSRHNAAYGYLPASIGAFETPAEFVKVLRQAGLSDILPIPLTFGSVILYTARRT